MIRLLFLILCSLFNVSSQADDFNELMDAHAKTIPLQLLEQCQEKIGEIEVQKLIRQIGTIDWKPFSGGFLAPHDPKEQRSGGVNFSGETSVSYVNTLSLRYSTENGLALFGLHESLRVLRYSDKDYELTLAFAHALLKKERKFHQDYAKALKPVLAAAEGGGSSVGGGGDPTAAEIKLGVFLLAEAWLASKHQGDQYRNLKLEKLLSSILEAPFEMNFRITQPEGPVFLDQEGTVRIHQPTWIGYFIIGQQELISEGYQAILEFLAKAN